MRFEPPIIDAVTALHRELISRQSSIAVAESCTGGLVGGAITAVGGSSEVFSLGIVSYSNQAKIELLGVPPETIEATGAVSGPTARAMAAGVRDRLDGTDWGLSITGLAGPTGGRPGKPIGTVYIGLATTGEDGTYSIARRVRFDGDRTAIRYQTVRAALELAVDAIGHSEIPSNRPS